MKYILLILTWYCAIYTSYGQTISIYDKSSNETILGAVVFSEMVEKSVVTNSQGQADISVFKGADQIEIRSFGYHNKVVSFENLEQSDFKVFMEEKSLGLDQVVVSATRWRQSSGNIPAKLSSISKEEISLLNPQTAADMLGISGKVFIQKSQQGGGSPMIRGFATNRLIYTIDGIRMNTAIFRGGNIQNVISLDPFVMENTEVLFGPGSVIYGSDAIGGVMSFQTLTPQLSSDSAPLINGKAVMRYSSANSEKTAHFDVNVGWKKWAFTSSITSYDYDHLQQGSHGPEAYIKPEYVQRIDGVDRIIQQEDPLLQIPSAYSQINMMQKIRFQPNEYWDFQYGFHFSETSPYGRYDRHNRYRNGTLRYATWDYGPQKWMMNNLNINHNKSNAFYDQFSLRIALQNFDESRIDRSLNQVDRSTNSEHVNAYSGNLDFVKSLGGRHTLFYGSEFILNQVNSDGEIMDIISGEIFPGPSRYPDANWYSAAIYLNDEYKVSKRFALQGGLRYNLFGLQADFSRNSAFYPFNFDEAEINNGALTGSIGGVYRPSDSWVLKTNFGTAFRSPNVDDIGKVFDSEPGAVTIPNPELKAEYAYNIDIGIAKLIQDAVKIDFTAYYTNLQNAFVRRNSQVDGQDSIIYHGELSQVQSLQNAAVANVYGVQAGIECKLPAGFRLLSDINYQVGREELADGSTSPSRHAAPLFGVTRLIFKQKKLKLEMNTQYQAERSFEDLAFDERRKDEIYAKDENGNNYAPAWYTLNIKAQYDVNKSFFINAGLENITDQRYRPYSSGISGAGRNFVMSVRVNF